MMVMVVDTLVLGLKAVAAILDWVTWVPYFILQRPDKVRGKSNRLRAVPANGDPSASWRSVDVPASGLATTLFPGCEVLPDLFARAVGLHGPQPCLGTREVLKEEEEVQPNGKVFKKVILGEYSWLNYNDMAIKVDNFGRGLSALNAKPGNNVVIFAETRAEWMISAQACFKNNFPVVTLYATLGVEAVVHGISETEVSHVITSMELLPKFESVLKETRTISHIIVMGATKPQLDSLKWAAASGVKVIAMMDVERIGANEMARGVNIVHKPRPDDTAVIMYTSGSTGLPKGVIISHRNLLCGTAGQVDRMDGLCDNDVFIAYLPLAHVLELAVEISCLAKGTKIGYSSPNTLTDKSSKIKKGSQGDVAVLKPTLLCAVPTIMDRIYKSAWEKVSSGSVVQQVLFKFAFDYKLKHRNNGYDTPLLNKIVFSKMQALLGGNIRLMLCGGAPLSGTTQNFMSVCFCCPISQGYGLTETCGAGTVLEFSDLTTERVGAPLISCELRLRDWEEGNYKAHDLPRPRGEILIGGDSITMGYYKNPSKTKEDFITIGNLRYFCTGDIGQFDEDGCLRIIDRKKDLVKLQHGEYVSLAQVETALGMCPLVDQICVVARSDQNSVVCLVVPNQAQLEAAAVHLGRPPCDLNSMCTDASVVAHVLKQMQTHGLKAKLQRTELPSAVTLCSEPWLPDTGLVTDSFKLKRKKMEDHFQQSIRTMYNL